MLLSYVCICEFQESFLPFAVIICNAFLSVGVPSWMEKYLPGLELTI